MRLSLPKMILGYIGFVAAGRPGSQFNAADDVIAHSEGEKSSDSSTLTSAESCVVDDASGGCLSDENEYSSSNQNIDKALNFRSFLLHIFGVIDGSVGKGRSVQDNLIISALLEYFKMDPSLFERKVTKLDGNWMEVLYDKIKDLAPPEFFKVWDVKRPTSEEVDIIATIDDHAREQATEYNPDYGSSFVNENKLLSSAFTPFRHRGFMPELLDTFGRLIMGPLEGIAYAIPSNEVLNKIAQYAPLIEIGAGTGYWSAVLQKVADVDIYPYDANPPKVDSKEDDKNVYFMSRSHTYTDVLSGDCESVFSSKEERYAKDHTLLIIWPNNPDNIDNDDEFYEDSLPPLWDSGCLSAFIHAGGTRVIYVGERTENIYHLPDKPQEVGLSASAKFQSMLTENFELEYQMDIPKWYYSDDVTFWNLKEAQ